jgi:NADH-quinone oxidoreductase subunit L
MFRLIFLTFFGKPRYDEKKVHVHESPWSMLGPLVVLAVLSVIGGWFALPGFFQGPDYFAKFLDPMFNPNNGSAGLQEGSNLALLPQAEEALHSLELILAGVAVAAALIGLGVAYWMYLKKPGKADSLAKSMRPAYTTLLNKYYVDELYAAIVVRPLLWISTNVFWKAADVAGIDGTVNGIAHGAAAIGDGVRHSQSGNTRSYAVWVVVGAIVLLAIIFFWPSGARTAVGMVR